MASRDGSEQLITIPAVPVTLGICVGVGVCVCIFLSRQSFLSFIQALAIGDSVSYTSSKLPAIKPLTFRFATAIYMLGIIWKKSRGGKSVEKEKFRCM